MTEEVESVYVARRVEGMPVPFLDSERRPCARCGAEVWVDPKTRAYWTKYPIICAPNCLNELLEENPGPHTIKIPRAVLESLKEIRDAQRSMRERR